MATRLLKALVHIKQDIIDDEDDLRLKLETAAEFVGVYLNRNLDKFFDGTTVTNESDLPKMVVSAVYLVFADLVYQRTLQVNQELKENPTFQRLTSSWRKRVFA